MSIDIITELDHEELFDSFCSALKQDKAKAFKKSYFISWLRKNRKDLWRSFRIKGSPHGQREGEEKFEELAEEILRVWANIGLLEGVDRRPYWGIRRLSYELYELTD